MLFRFVSIEKIDDPPSIHTTRGSLVHRALELAFTHPAAERARRTLRGVRRAGDRRVPPPRPTSPGSALDDDAAERLFTECRRLVDNYLRMEDPRAIEAIGLELSLGTQVDGLHLRGIIDRLELRDGELVVTDYKTGRPPSANWELRSLSGVRFYALLCKQVFGRLPAAVRLLYLSSGEIIEAHTVRAGHNVRRRPHGGGLEGGRAGLPHRRLQAAPDGAVRAVRFPAVVPGVRRRPGTGRRGGPRRLRADPGVNLCRVTSNVSTTGPTISSS